MTNERFSRTPPVRANELFEKLLATSENALKTRERLLADLKEELELLARLQEQHLFPVLRQHGMRDLVQEAIKDNEETSTLLAQLERTPKNDAGFLSRVAELRKVFQQHIRDDKKELLPAVLKVLSDEEANAVVEKVEDEMAQNQEAKRAETRQAREQAETVQRVTEDMADTLRAGVEGAQTAVRTLQETVQTSFEAVSKIARRSTDQSVQLFSRADAQDLAGQASENLRAIAASSTALVRGVQDMSREAVELSQKRLQTNLDGFNQMTRCRSLADLVAAQTFLFRENLEQTLNNSRRLAELTIRVTDEATRTVTAQVEKTTQHLNRAA
jgi:hemerythrin-like domain-containing protein